MVNADLRSAEIIRRLVNIDFPSVAEVGVFRGDVSRRLLYRLNLHLLMVDPWDATTEESGSAQRDAINAVSWASDRVRVFHGTSKDAAESMDEHFDMVFIGDAIEDIELWWGKVAGGGYIGGNGYTEQEDFVPKAIDDFCERHELVIELGHENTWFVRKE